MDEQVNKTKLTEIKMFTSWYDLGLLTEQLTLCL